MLLHLLIDRLLLLLLHLLLLHCKDVRVLVVEDIWIWWLRWHLSTWELNGRRRTTLGGGRLSQLRLLLLLIHHDWLGLAWRGHHHLWWRHHHGLLPWHHHWLLSWHHHRRLSSWLHHLHLRWVHRVSTWTWREGLTCRRRRYLKLVLLLIWLLIIHLIYYTCP